MDMRSMNVMSRLSELQGERMKFAKRKILYTETANGSVKWYPFNKDGYNRNDEVEVVIAPDDGYMMGYVLLCEEQNGHIISYRFEDKVYHLIKEHSEEPVGILFSMPNDNVKLIVKFNKKLV